MAARDFSQWRATVLDALPGGSGVICLDSTADDGTAASPACDGSGAQVAIKVFWTERGVASRFVNVVRP
jgi:type IV pilus assembly protein PilV